TIKFMECIKETVKETPMALLNAAIFVGRLWF
ncbi:MAG: hypothetical protein UX22_C0011G0001, partial [Candidatus Jorgensenbacteria bacterium GW2011_GWA2_45_9]